jgi:hypothetical protein
MNLKFVINRKGIRTRLFLILFSGFGFHSPLFAYEVIPVENGGELHGTISFRGKPPDNLSHDVDRDAAVCGPNVLEETYMVKAKKQGLQNVVIWIEGLTQGKASLSSIAVIENRNCHFVPHVQAAMIGQSYEVRNTDPIMHNTHLKMEDHTLLNIIMPAQGKNIKKEIRESGLIKIKCDVHKFMLGWFVATDNPYFAVTADDGNYQISDIPPGKYKINVWHEGLPVKESEVTIFPGRRRSLSMELGLE